MTLAQMIAELDLLLDQTATASTFWTLTHYYTELSAGQREVASILNKKGSDKISSLLKHFEVTSNYYGTCPADFMDIHAARFAYDGTTYYPCDVYTYEKYLNAISNVYKVPGLQDPIVYIRATTSLGRKIYFYPVHATPTTSNGEVIYIAGPTDIDGSTQPVLPPETHNAIVKFAFARLLERDKRMDESAKAIKEFYGLVEAL